MATELKATLDDLQVLKTLGKGAYAKVKLVQDQEGNQLAAKIMLQSNASAKNFQDMVNSEVKLMQQIDHPNVVKVLRTKEDGAYVKKNGDKKSVMYILMELASGGEMIEYLLQTGRFEDNICRTYFLQIMSAIGAVHQSGISHRDLKPENILFDKDFNIKIADFGFAIYMSGRDGTGILKSHLGTESYMAPEIHEYKGYQGATIDLFALGIILFIMKSQNPPFTKANQNDPWYQRLSKSPQVFWAAHNKAKGGNFYSAEFTDLINKMLAYNPQDRLTHEQIISHPWMQGPTVSQEELKQEFQTRLARIQEAADKLRKQKEAQKSQRPQFGGQAYRQGRVFRGEDFNKSETLAMSQIGDSQILSNRFEPIESFGESSQSGCLNFKIQQYTKGPLKWSQFLSKLTPEDLMDSLDCWLSKNAKDYEVKDQSKFKAKFEIEDQEVGVTFKLYEAEGQLLIDITKEFGSAICFQQQVKKILEDPEILELSEGEPLIV